MLAMAWTVVIDESWADGESPPSEVAVSSLVKTGDVPMSLAAPATFRLPVTRQISEKVREELLLIKAEHAALGWAAESGA
jgi:hypothetical protein